MKPLKDMDLDTYKSASIDHIEVLGVNSIRIHFEDNCWGERVPTLELEVEHFGMGLYGFVGEQK